MHREILTPEQVQLLPLVASFGKDFGLVGGTAIALHIGHRESIDFDLFSGEAFNSAALKRKVAQFQPAITTLVNKKGEFTFIINEVKMTFFHFPFVIPYEEKFENVICTPTLLTLAAMKVYALGMRAKWKDYVDLYFIFRDHHSLSEVVERTGELFGTDFNEKIFRTQLSYFEDINYSEQVVFRPGFEVDEKEVQERLIEWSLS